MRYPMIVLSALSICAPVLAGAQDADIGETLYTQYCATCHGVDGAGEGPMTQIMLEKPSDLRMMAAKNSMSEGEFPMLKVIHIIDGRSGLRAHGGSMPTYGNVFMAESTDMMEKSGAVLETRGRILSLAMYLESIQQ